MAKREQLTYQDFVPLHNKARQYISPSTGEVISIRQFQTLSHGGIPLQQRSKIIQEYQKISKGKQAPSQQYIRNEYRIQQKIKETRKITIASEKAKRAVLDQSILRDYLRTKNEQGASLTEAQAKASKEFKDILRDLKYKSNKPTGKKAQALIKIGRR